MAKARRRILFFTNSDYGQANVVLAAAHALICAVPHVEIHIASFHALQTAVHDTSAHALETAPKGPTRHPLQFHGLYGISWGPASFRPEVGMTEAYDLEPSLINSAKNMLVIPAIMLPWQPEEFTAIYLQASRILAEVEPDLTIVEPLFTPGLTLCHHLHLNWVVLAPNTIKDFAVPAQPGLAMLWKYPLVCSALPYPLPWSLIPRNIILNLVAGYALLTNQRISSTTAHLHQQIDTSISLMTANELGVLKAPPPGLRILASGAQDIDYPFAVLPPHLVACGPIVRAVKPADSELTRWLTRGPTLYVNLGTHLKAGVAEALEMAGALRRVLDCEAGGRSLQILWKLGRKAAVGEKLERDRFDGPWERVCDVLRSEIEQDRVRITDWVASEPKAVLESGGVVCSLHHGGANSFNEALCAGIPQVLLPPWSDCYDFGNRVELLGIGRWANQQAKPRWKREELASCLEEVLYGPRAKKMYDRAKGLARRHPEFAGRDKAAREILASLEED